MVKPQRLEVFRGFNLNLLLVLQKLLVDIQKGRSRALYSLAVLRINANDGSDVKQYDSVKFAEEFKRKSFYNAIEYKTAYIQRICLAS